MYIEAIDYFQIIKEVKNHKKNKNKYTYLTKIYLFN